MNMDIEKMWEIEDEVKEACFTMYMIKDVIDVLNSQLVKKGNTLVNPQDNQELIARLGVFFSYVKKELLESLRSMDKESEDKTHE